MDSNSVEEKLPGRLYASVNVNQPEGSRITVKYRPEKDEIGIHLDDSYLSMPLVTWNAMTRMVDSVIPSCCKAVHSHT